MAMTQSEIANLKKKIAAGTYTDDDILNDVAEGTYGVEVRRKRRLPAAPAQGGTAEEKGNPPQAEAESPDSDLPHLSDYCRGSLPADSASQRLRKRLHRDGA